MNKFWSILSGCFLIGLSLVAWLFPINNEKSAVDIAITQNVEIAANPDISKKGSLEFVYNGEKVPNLLSTKLRLRNAGTEAISEADFIEGLRVIFPDDAKVISYTVLQVQPLNEFSLFQQGFIQQVSDNQIKFTPVLLNPGDVFDIDIISTQQSIASVMQAPKPENIRLEYRIVGVTKINKIEEIDTNAERQLSARADIKKGLEVIWKYLLVFGPLFLVVWVLGEVIKRLPKKESIKKKEPNPKLDKFIEVVSTVILFSLFAAPFVFIGGKLIIEAWFLPI